MRPTLRAPRCLHRNRPYGVVVGDYQEDRDAAQTAIVSVASARLLISQKTADISPLIAVL